MSGYLLFCLTCQRAVEGVLLNPGVESYRATTTFADDHHAQHGHWPERAVIRPACTDALRLVGRKR